MAIVLVISLYTTRKVLSILGVVDYGIYNVVAGFVSMFAFLNTSMSSTSQRYFNVEYAKTGTKGTVGVYNASLRIHVLLAFLIVVVAEVVGVWYLHNKMVLPEGRMFAAECVFHGSVVSMFFTIVSVPFLSVIMAHENMDYYAVVTIVDALLKLGIVVALPLFAYDKLAMYGLLYAAISLFNFLAYMIYAKIKFEEIKFCWSSSINLFWEMVRFSLWNALGSFSYVLRNQGVNLVLNAYFGPVVNAARGVANQVDGAICGFVNNLIVPARPQITQSYAGGNKERAFRVTYSISKLSCLFFFCLSLPVIIESNYIFRLWLGDTVPAHTRSFVSIILLTNMFGCLLPPISTLVLAEGKMRYYQILTSMSNLMSIPLAIVFLLFDKVPEYVFIALFITMSTNHIAAMIALKKYCDYSIVDYLKKVLSPILKVCLASLCVSLPVHYLMQESMARFLLQFSVCVASVILTAYKWALDVGERRFVVDFIRKFFKH